MNIAQSNVKFGRNNILVEKNSTMPYTGKKKYYESNWLMQRRRARKRINTNAKFVGFMRKSMDKNYQYTIRSLLFTSNLTKKLIDFKILFLFVNHAIGRYIKGATSFFVLLRQNKIYKSS